MSGDLVHVRGLSALQTFLDQLPPKIERNVLRGGLRAGAAKVLLPAARAGIRSVSGETARSLKVGTDTRDGQVTASVYSKSPVARWLEYGTRPHQIVPKNRQALVIGGVFLAVVDHPGVRPRPFLRPALDTQAAAAVVAAAEYMKARLETESGLNTSDIQIESVASP